MSEPYCTKDFGTEVGLGSPRCWCTGIVSNTKSADVVSELTNGKSS